MYVAMGALSTEQKTEIADMLPSWYSLEFQQCWADETNLDYPHCKELNEMHQQLSTEDSNEMIESTWLSPVNAWNSPKGSYLRPAEDRRRLVPSRFSGGVRPARKMD